MNRLIQLHQKVLGLAKDYTPPFHLMDRVDEAYRIAMCGGEDGVRYYSWLALAVRILKPKRILELGSHFGNSAIMMYSEIENGSELISIDYEKKLIHIPETMFSDPRVKFITGNDLELNTYQNVGVIDFLYIDTIHEQQHLEKEWEICQHLCKNGALVVLDDIRMNDMYYFWEKILYPKLEITTDCHNSGYGVFLFDNNYVKG